MNTAQIAFALANFGREVVRRRGLGAIFSRNVLERIIHQACRLDIIISGRLISLWKGEFNINFNQETRSEKFIYIVHSSSALAMIENVEMLNGVS